MNTTHDHSHAGHAHDGGGHAHGPANFGRAFAIGIGLNVAFVAIEFAYGVLANSMALVADAGHNLSDVLGLVVAWIAAMLTKRPPSAPLQLRPAGHRRSWPRCSTRCSC